MSRPPREILVRPIVTEESSRLQFNPGRIRKRHQGKERAERQKFVFEVVRDANKVEIRRAVEQMFEVQVLDVRTMNCLGKDHRVGRHVGRRPHWKKAIITLAEGETIDMYEGA